MKKRAYYRNVWEAFDAEKHLVFMSGPRQTGKTTLARDIASREASSVYFNYDVPTDRAKLLRNPVFFEETDREKGDVPLIVLDEIHKYSDWKNYLKGAYDGYSGAFRFLVTGSGRLDLSRHRGDSLAGRYLHFHIFPFTLGEVFSSSVAIIDQEHLNTVPEKNRQARKAWETMFHVSGFPEPFIKGSETSYRRWAASYHSQVIRDDIRDEFAVRRVDRMEMLYMMLADRVGSPISVSSLAQTLKVAHTTVTSWLDVLERFFLTFRLRPYSRRVSRSIVKDAKLYFYDYRRIDDPGARFENMVAVELNRAVTLWRDFGLGDFQLLYLRNKDKQEVDFIVAEGSVPRFIVEAKLSDPAVGPQLKKFQSMLNVPAIQLINRSGVGRLINNDGNTILVASAADWLAGLH